MNVISFAELGRRLERFDIISETGDALEKTGAEAADLVKERLYSEGTDMDDNKLEPYKSDYYARRKNRMNSQPGFGTPDLYLTGKLYGDLALAVGSNTADFTSPVEYFDHVYDRDQGKAFGLNAGGKTIFRRQHLYPELRMQLIAKTCGRLIS